MVEPQSEIHRTTASDGWPLSLRHYPAGGANPHGEPVLVQHGLGTCSMQFDLPLPQSAVPTPSLSRWLAAQGYSVWSPDLRGSGHSTHPGKSGLSRWGWCVDDHIHQDTPALIAYILGRSSHEQLHWVGHSMGGILLLCHCVTYGSEQIASGVAAASGFDYSMSASRYDFIVPLRKLGLLVRRVPSGFFSNLMSPFAGRVNNAFEQSFYYPPNLSPVAARAIFSKAHYDVSGEVLNQLASLFQPGGLRSRDGVVQYGAKATQIRTPIQFLTGEWDQQCPPPVAEHSLGLLGGDQHEIQYFGKRHGHVEDYGHFDLLAGLRADQEVFPHILRWLQTHPIGGAE